MTTESNQREAGAIAVLSCNDALPNSNYEIGGERHF